VNFKALERAFQTELEKIGASLGMFRHGKVRVGKKPMAIATLLKKDGNRTLMKAHGPLVDLFKEAGLLDKTANTGGPMPVGYINDSTGSSTRAPRRRGQIPSKEDMEDPDLLKTEKQDPRSFSQVVPGTGSNLSMDFTSTPGGERFS